MIIDKGVFETMIILLYKINEFEACTALLAVYRRTYCEESEGLTLRLIKDEERTV